MSFNKKASNYAYKYGAGRHGLLAKSYTVGKELHLEVADGRMDDCLKTAGDAEGGFEAILTGSSESITHLHT